MTRSLEDVLVSSIQRAPCQEISKLALADLLEERCQSREAQALRWCAANRKWPQRRYYNASTPWAMVYDRSMNLKSVWQWWHSSCEQHRRHPGPGRCPTRPYAILPREFSDNWPTGQAWGHDTWFGALTAVEMAIEGTTRKLWRIHMTVESLDSARAIVHEDQSVESVYAYHHAITGKKLWSVEYEYTRGSTLASGYTISPRIIYTKEEGWLS